MILTYNMYCPSKFKSGKFYILNQEVKMVKKLVCILIAGMLIIFGANAYAATDDLLPAMGAKALRGIVNACTGWTEVPMQVVKGWNRGFITDEKNKLAGAVCGVVAGACYAVGRTVSGVCDLVGFWLPDNANNESMGIKLDAEYAWEEGAPYDLWKPNLGEATFKPMGNKLVRGAGNLLCGIAEVPGQIIKGSKEDALLMGIVKGFWFFFGREVNGACEMLTFCVPGPEDTKGYPFEEAYAWSALGDSFGK